MKTLLVLGYGYTAAALAERLLPQGWQIIGTTREADKLAAMQAQGVEALLWPCDLTRGLRACDAYPRLCRARREWRPLPASRPQPDRGQCGRMAGLSVHHRRLWRSRRGLGR